ncbi:MAG TPA: RpiB/LacA/LacB family sugar-phosphate isomerase [Ilumatobacter sp.]|nr:RpiB/LacA/LacB family sugar-phosphate isomerase [Ilumatobacter sp.]
MRIALGADASHPLVEAVRAWCRQAGHVVDVVADAAAWPEAGRLVGETVASGSAERGVVLCWTGTGVSIAANKVPGVRAALCADAETARGARRWNDANVLALSMRSTTAAVAEEILAAFFGTDDVDPAEAPNIARLG